MPSEVGGHATYDLTAVGRAIDNSIATSPRFSFRRRFPIVLFLDNNFSDDRAYMLKLCEMMRADSRILGWAALVTQNVLADRALVRRLADCKCVGLFAGIESFDADMLRSFNKRQNLGRKNSVLGDIEHAERLGVAIAYGYLFDPIHQSAEAMARQMPFVAREPRLPMPVYLSVVAPLRGNAILLGGARGRQSGGRSQAARPRWQIALSCQSGRRARPHRRVPSRICSAGPGSSQVAGASCSRRCAASQDREAGIRSAGT